MHHPSLVRMGDLTKATGVTDQTVRYYERLGLIESCSRTKGGFRLFDLEAIPRIHTIKLAQALGFKLREIRRLMDSGMKEDQGCLSIQHLLDAKVMELGRRIRLLGSHVDMLQGVRARCGHCEGPCLVPETLATLAQGDGGQLRGDKTPVVTPGSGGVFGDGG